MLKGAGRVSGLGDSDGPCVAVRYPRRRPGIPPPRLRSAPPFDKGGFSRGLRPRKKAPLLGELAELARPEGSRRALRHLPSTDSHPSTFRTLPACFAATSPDGEAFLAGSARAKGSPSGELAELARPEGLYVTAPSKLRKPPSPFSTKFPIPARAAPRQIPQR